MIETLLELSRIQKRFVRICAGAREGIGRRSLVRAIALGVTTVPAVVGPVALSGPCSLRKIEDCFNRFLVLPPFTLNCGVDSNDGVAQ